MIPVRDYSNVSESKEKASDCRDVGMQKPLVDD